MTSSHLAHGPLFLRCHSRLAQQALQSAFVQPRLDWLASPAQLPRSPCGLLLLDQPLRHEVLLLGQWLHHQRPACRSLYLVSQVTALRWVVAKRCGAVGFIDLSEAPLDHLPLRVETAWLRPSFAAPSLAAQTELVQALSQLSLGKLLVLVQWVEGARPRIIAQRLGLSLGNVYQVQARLRAELGVHDQAALWDLLRPPMASLLAKEV